MATIISYVGAGCAVFDLPVEIERPLQAAHCTAPPAQVMSSRILPIYREAVKAVIRKYAKLRPSHGQIRQETVFDEDQDRYALMHFRLEFTHRVALLRPPQPRIKNGILWYNFLMLKSNYSERKGKLSELDRSFDLAFWQSQPPAARFASAWELVTHYATVNGLAVRQLRLDRSTESYQRQQR